MGLVDQIKFEKDQLLFRNTEKYYTYTKAAQTMDSKMENSVFT